MNNDNVNNRLRSELNEIGSCFPLESHVIHKTLLGEWVLGFREAVPVWTVKGHGDQPGRLLVLRGPADADFYMDFELLSYSEAIEVVGRLQANAANLKLPQVTP